MNQILFPFSRLFDRIFTSERVNKFERAIVYVAIAGFLLHLGAIFLVKHWGINFTSTVIHPYYFSAIATPFTILLFFEIFLLIMSIPKSITSSIGRQYEIISLIVIREVFKDLGVFEGVTDFINQFDVFKTILLDLTGGLIMFLLVTVFYHIRNKKRQEAGSRVKVDFSGFVSLKKTVALFLSLFLFVLAVASVYAWLVDVVAFLNGSLVAVPADLDFYKSVFTLMVFTDVFMLIFSYIYTCDYELFFRNSGFVLSTILIRISLTLPKTYSVALAILAMLFGIGTLLIYRYFKRVVKV